MPIEQLIERVAELWAEGNTAGAAAMAATLESQLLHELEPIELVA